ncbi:heavy metal translocating P-type ATPase [[Mycoplasma] collis]|uniref:heavy metal translocating P-type ATPase n=1 Tax=[Mycoplasma] collis TaxID=2127 RepID=UPI00051AB565|nr:cation-translocating P-type ATPase [[Mycoplasma] collis]
MKLNNFFKKRKIKIFTQLIFFIFIFVLMFLHFLVGSKINNTTKNVLTLILIIFSFFVVFYLEIKSFIQYKLVFKKILTMELLISFSSHIAFFYSFFNQIILFSINKNLNLDKSFWEIPITLFFFYNIGKLIEEKLLFKSNEGIQNILNLLKNKNISVLRNDKWETVNSNLIKKDEIIKVKKGENVLFDSVLISDSAILNFSSINGESKNKIFKKDDVILSGCINEGEIFLAKTLKDMKNSYISQIFKKLQSMLNNKTKIVIISEKIIKYFIPFILLISFLAFIIWLNLGYFIKPQNFHKLYSGPRENFLHDAIWVSCAVLVVACPCAFGIAAPIAIYSSSILSSQNNILFSNANVYEKIINSKTIVFDKTGTLTEAKSKITKELWMDITKKNILKSLVYNSDHPISQTINEYLIDSEIYKINNFYEKIGQGIIGEYQGKEYKFISLKAVKSLNIELNENITNYNLFFLENNNIIAAFKSENVLKKNAKNLIEKLKNEKYNIYILSGDSKNNVLNIANQLKINNYFYELLPEKKLEIIDELKKKNNVIFVGDGLNDILAMKKADLSISFSSGNDLTNSISDITLLEDDLSLINKSFFIIKKTSKLIKLNFTWAFLFNFVMIPLALFGVIVPTLAMFLMVSSSIFLILNTILFNKWNKKKLKLI